MNTLCKYRHALGEEKKGFHATRFLGVALWDTIGTVAIAVFISYVFGVSLIWTVVALFGIAIVLHRLFCVNTTINKLIFGVIS